MPEITSITSSTCNPIAVAMEILEFLEIITEAAKSFEGLGYA
jgi:hypothetical protein